ncbi:dinucleotide-utilizing enzyme possibly involved in molybdopterin or thiamin biosynthesis [Rheinheimera sp. A13L]|uniref:HesA/MoeB/ThiF family protein n=1 Tax=Rheinheimera sp. A13L TaxID=506534 RepID=UPI0002125026|nr:dinucleotide-utilizing enzyme possibly involved in molybdopterin or thiamin biosynthesis [Rheinheimera sp. A13L]
MLLVGLGGVGSAAAPYLVSSGLGHLTLVDFDQVSLSNLPRQLLYRDADLGLDKVQVAQQKLQLLNPACSLQSWSVKARVMPTRCFMPSEISAGLLSSAWLIYTSSGLCSSQSLISALFLDSCFTA